MFSEKEREACSIICFASTAKEKGPRMTRPLFLYEREGGGGEGKGEETRSFLRGWGREENHSRERKCLKINYLVCKDKKGIQAEMTGKGRSLHIF